MNYITLFNFTINFLYWLPLVISFDDMEVFVAFTKTIVPTLSISKSKRIFGVGKGSITYINTDFDEPLDDLKDYM
jgi:hypothetical protein